MAALVLGSIVCSVALFSFLYRTREASLRRWQEENKISMLSDSVRTRIAGMAGVDDYEGVDEVMTDAFSFEETVTDALVVDRDGRIYYDLRGGREGKKYEEKMMSKGIEYMAKDIVLSRGVGLIDGQTSVVGKLVVGYRDDSERVEGRQEVVIEYARQLATDVSRKLEANEVDSAKYMVTNMFLNSRNIEALRWVNRDGTTIVDLWRNKRGRTIQGMADVWPNWMSDEFAADRAARDRLKITKTEDRYGNPMYEIGILLMRRGKEVGAIGFLYSDAEFAAMKRRSMLLFGYVMFAMMISSIFLALAVSYYISRPLGKLAYEVRKAATGTLEDFEIVPSSIKEVMELNVGMEEMICERLASEEALKSSEAKYRSLFESSPDAVMTIGVDGRFKDLNDAATELVGYTREDLIGKHFAELMMLYEEEELERVMQVFTKLVQEGFLITEYGLQLTTKDGEKRDVITHNSVVKEQGEMVALQIVIHDITESLAAEKELKKSEWKWRTLVHNAPNIIIITDREGGIRFINREVPEVEGKGIASIYNYYAPEYHDEMRDALEEVFRTGEPVRLEVGGFLTSDRIAYYEIDMGLIPGAGEEDTVIQIISDVTKRKQVEAEKDLLRQQLLQAQKMEAIGQLAGGIAHDFNNMLTVILGNVNLALMHTDNDDPNAVGLKEIMGATLRARDLTMKLLTFARKGKVTSRKIHAAKIVGDVVSMLERSVDKKIRIRTPVLESALLNADKNQLQQALLNICTNACDAMPSGGDLTIEVKKVTLDAEYCRLHADVEPGRHCLIMVSDTGTGIPKDILVKVFEPFFTTKGVGKGTGLGLATAMGIIKSHKGCIQIYSDSGEGTVVKVYLPVLQEAEAEETAMILEEIKPGTETILVVDDERHVLTVARKALEKAGYKVLSADGGKSGVELYEANKGEIALVVLDMIMPDMDGREVFLALKEINPDVKVILASGYSINGQAGKLLKEGVNSFVQKPFSIYDICNEVRKVLDGKTGSGVET